MQYLTINRSDTLQTITNIVGRQNVEFVLSENSLVRVPKVGEQYYKKCEKYIESNPEEVTGSRKKALLDGTTDNEEVFEKACLMDEDEWKIFSAFQSFRDAIKIPETVVLPFSSRVIGSKIGSSTVKLGSNVITTQSESVDPIIYNKVMDCLKEDPAIIDPSIFNDYSTARPVSLTSSKSTIRAEARAPQYSYNLPWGKVQLYSSLLDQAIDIPVYPESLETERTASYTSMPDIIYQYEPWITYQSSGPREQSLEFHLHRDLWSGDHRDGKANELIRFCEANTFARYTGSTVQASTVSLYISGEVFISGVLTRTNVSWAGPLGLDNWYLEFTLRLTIQEVAKQALNIDSVRKMGLIG